MKKTKVVMFNPQPSPKMAFDGPPLSLLMAVSMLDRDKYDINILVWQYKDCRERLISCCRDAMVLGITCMTGYQVGKMLEAAKLARQINPDIKIVIGGWHPTLKPEQTLENELVDYIVMGQGPRVFAQLLDGLRDNRDITDIQGLGYKENGKLVIGERAPLENVNAYPWPPYELLDDLNFFFTQSSFAKRALWMLTSQGCPGNCNFCSEAAFYARKWSARPVDEVIEKIAYYKKEYKIDGFMIGDSNFFVGEKRVAEFCRKLVPLKIRWGGTSSRPDQLARFSDETWQLMADSGLYDIFLGVESANNDILKLMNKGCTIEHTLSAIPKAKKHNIRLQCAFMIGIPGADIDFEFKENMKLINKLRKTGDVAQFHMFTFIPFPGVPFIEEAKKLGYKEPDNLDGWNDYHIHANVAPWIPKKYRGLTDQLSYYFMFLSGNTDTIIRAVMPRWLLWLALPAERIARKIIDLRVTYSCFLFPVEYWISKFVLKHRSLFFRNKRIAI